MKILVFSDSHNTIKYMFAAIEREKPDLILHLGDHDRDCEDISLLHPSLAIRTVRGNCDHGSQGLDIDEFVIDGKRFLMTHGHIFGVKMGMNRIRGCALGRNANIVLFGHTHRPYHQISDAITYINPGSIGSGANSYAALNLIDGTLTCELKCI